VYYYGVVAGHTSWLTVEAEVIGVNSIPQITLLSPLPIPFKNPPSTVNASSFSGTPLQL